MVSFRQAQTGNRVYNGVSQSPNRGQVSSRGAQGYIGRELRNKARSGVVTPVGRDGKSDNRSTVAAQALSRTRLPPRSHDPNGPMGSGGRPPGQGPKGNNPFQNGGRNPNQNNGPQPGQNGGPHDGPGGQAPTNNVIKVTKDGILQLPYNQDFAADQWQAVGDAQNQLLGLAADGRTQAMQYSDQRNQLNRDMTSARGTILNKNAAGGTAFSSAYGTQLDASNRGYLDEIGGLDRANSEFQLQQGFQQNAIMQALNQQLGLGMQSYGDSLNSQAGQLGYGQGTRGIRDGMNTSIHAGDDNSIHMGQGGRNRGGKGKGKGKNRFKSSPMPQINQADTAKLWLQRNGGSGPRPVVR